MRGRARAATITSRVVGAVMTGLMVVALAAPASASIDDGGWVIESFEVLVDIRPDGVVDVMERIDVDFGALERRGIFRVIPVRYEVGPDPAVALPPGVGTSDIWRAIHIDRIAVESTAPDDIEVSRPNRLGGREMRIRIGDPDRTVSGRQRYEITYRVQGAMNSLGSHEELYWNLTGQWPVPIRTAAATIRGPQLTRLACFRGETGSSRLCDNTTAPSGSEPARVRADGLSAHEALTVVVGTAPGAVQVPPPPLVEKWTPRRALTGSDLAWPLAMLVALLVAAGLGRLLYREGRDRLAHGPETVDGRSTDEPRIRPLGQRTAPPVRFRPPDGLRPAQLGVLVDERVDPVEIGATIVDLAVRGHLVIVEEQSKRLWMTRTDWTLRRAPDADDPLLGYEKTLLDGLFSGRDEVSVSDLEGAFADDYTKVRSALYADAVDRRWFRRDPGRTRMLWLAAGVLGTVAGLGMLVLLAIFTTTAVVALPLVLGGVVLVVAHRWMPRRTAEGSRVLAEALGFREYIRTAEAGRMDFAEQENLFLEYLPFAVVFGATGKWAEAFSGLDMAAATAGTWYVGPGGRGPDLAGLSGGLSDFSSTVGGSLSKAPASSGSSGFSGGSSGGGFGGGGGGSW